MYFPISDIYFSIVTIFCTGLLGGFVSGFLGIGCGVIITPLLVDLGLSPFTAVSTQLCHAVGTNFTNFLTYKKKTDVDYHFAWYILVGGLLGSICEYIFLKYASNAQSIVNKFTYIYISALTMFGFVMLRQAYEAWKNSNKITKIKSIMMRRWMLYLPKHKIFVRSRTEMSIIVPIFIGFLTGILVAALGGGNSLFMTPIVTYLIGRISPVVNGTTSLAGCIITAIVALIYAANNYFCDIYIVFILFTGASIGSWIGVRYTYKIKRYYIYAFSACIVFLMAIKQFYKMIISHDSYAPRPISSSALIDFISKHQLLYTLTVIGLILFYSYTCHKYLNILAKRYKKL